MPDDDPDDPDDGGAPRFTPPPRHVAADRFATGAIRSAQAITDGLAEAGVAADDPVVIDRAGPRHSLAALDRLLSSALEAEAGESTDAADEAISPEEPPPGGR